MKNVLIDLLLLVDNTVRPQVPPLTRRKIGRNFRLGATAAKPLNQVQVVGLLQPQCQVQQFGVLGESRQAMHLKHELKDSLLGAISKEELHASAACPGAGKGRERKMK